jgi:hypothetical protein
MIRFVLAIALVCAVPAAASQAVQKVPRVGVLYMGGPTSSEDSSIGFGRGMRELGYTAGQNVVLDYRYADGRPERLESVVRRALSRASWCSADPVCSENLGGQGSRLANLAACHACVLLPETSCETINEGLDRAMLVGTPNERDRGWMSDLLDQAYAWT